MVSVMHPGSVVVTYPLERLTKLHDGLEQLQEVWWDDSYGEEEVWSMGPDGSWQPQPPHFADGDEWEEMSDEDDNFMVTYDDTEPVEDTPTTNSPALETLPSSLMQIIDSNTPKDSPFDDDDDDSADSNMHDGPATPLSPTDVPNDATVDATVADDSHNEAPAPPQFDVLPSAPRDHAFYDSPPVQMSGPFLVRVTREYRVLQNCLPGSFLLTIYFQHLSDH
jgi:ubiquitin-conjugating enzyme E2 O